MKKFYDYGISQKLLKSELKKFKRGTKEDKMHHNIKALLVVIGLFLGIGLLMAIFSGPSQRQAVRTSREAVDKSRPAVSRPDIPVPEPQPTYMLEILSWRWSRSGSGNYVKIEGEVKNICGRSLRSVEALVSFYDNNGTFITSGSSFIEFNPILPGQKSPFSVLERYNPAMARAKTTLQFKFFAGELIRARWK